MMVVEGREEEGDVGGDGLNLKRRRRRKILGFQEGEREVM